MAQTAVKAAHLEENALLWAGGELAPCASLQLLGQAEAWNRHNEAQFVKASDEITEIFMILAQLTSKKKKKVLTCRASVIGGHVKAIVLMGSVGVRVSWDMDTTDGRLHPVGVSKMEAALEAALVF